MHLKCILKALQKLLDALNRPFRNMLDALFDAVYMPFGSLIKDYRDLKKHLRHLLKAFQMPFGCIVETYRGLKDAF